MIWSSSSCLPLLLLLQLLPWILFRSNLLFLTLLQQAGHTGDGCRVLTGATDHDLISWISMKVVSLLDYLKFACAAFSKPA
eukprot:CAMPEP_0117666108 /NCGR_PEP_ID=MMETSP0804-20121206/10188_1 /TAXON_ID=1074897 /ORGANISM="Tetraselmis astigmatica, Strain CCMP880" /LENGTH=80 /DNA_ID=CAMNT_0005473607 /DNA_START=639 /DNA_END=881 /DNA_ORIENTATION=+